MVWRISSLKEYISAAKSRNDIRKLAYAFRKCLKKENDKYFPIVETLDALSEMCDKFNYEIVENDKIKSKSVHAYTDIIAGQVCIKQSVYEGACNGNGRDRMTIAHEIGHFLLHSLYEFKLERNFDGKKAKVCQDIEWQAKCFAGELLIPTHLMKGCSIKEIMKECGVSHCAAEYQHRKMNQ